MARQIKELFSQLREMTDGVKRVTNLLPGTEQNIADEYQHQILHAGGETLQVIDQLMNGESRLLSPVLQDTETFQDYIDRFGQQERENVDTAANYVVVTLKGQKFLGISRLVKRDLSLAELREMYELGPEYSDEVIKEAQQQEQLEISSDVGVHISFASMPLHAVSEVHREGTKSAKLAAHAAATTLLTGAEVSQKVSNEYQDHCHDEDPTFSYSQPHFITPLGIALSSATDPETLDKLLVVTAQTTAIAHGTSQPALGEVTHLHHLAAQPAEQQVRAVSESGIFGGSKTFDLTFWLLGWNSVVDGYSQAELRQQFQVDELNQRSGLLIAKGMSDLSQTERSNMTIFTGLATVEHNNLGKLQTQVAKLHQPENLSRSVTQLFRGKED